MQMHMAGFALWRPSSMCEDNASCIYVDNEYNDMQSHKLGVAMFDEDDIFVPQVLMSKFTMIKAYFLSMMIIVMTRML